MCLRRISYELIHRLQEDLLPSIGQVQSICLATLNDLLSADTHWAPIVPDRRHSMPHPSHLAPSSSIAPDRTQQSSALQTLITNLRLQNANGDMTQTAESLSDTELLHELRTRVDRTASGLSARDAELARTLVSLLTHFHRLSLLTPLVATTSSSPTRVASWNVGFRRRSFGSARSP